MASDLFENLNNLKNLEFLEATNPEELKAQILSIRLPTRLVAMYSVGTKHIAWIQTTMPIKKKKKEN